MELYAKKSLGQHFLNSKHVLDQIIETASLQKGEMVLEIGPGTGVLTEALLETGVKVIAIEKDVRAIGLLQTKFEVASHSGQLNVIEGDVLDETFNERFTILDGGYSIVANIPYYITGAILEKFLEQEPRPNRMVLLVQREVAERIISGTSIANSKGNNDGKESILSISVKAFGTPKLIAKVPRGAFTPAPTVDSAILSITDISNKKFIANNVEISDFFDIVHAGFAHKRKFLIRNLESVSITKDPKKSVHVDQQKLATIWVDLGFDPKTRAEDLSVDQWISLASRFMIQSVGEIEC